MTNQEIFEILSDTEEKLFYALCEVPGNAELKAAHASVRAALVAFSETTGCHN
jgi:hypothetical protein